MNERKKTYIYESPDKGKTILRREFGVYGKRELKFPRPLIDLVDSADNYNPMMLVIESDISSYKWIPERK